MTRTAKVDLLIQIVLLVAGTIAGIMIIKYLGEPDMFMSKSALKYEFPTEFEDSYENVLIMILVKCEILFLKIWGEIPFGYWLGKIMGLTISMLINTILGTDIISYYVRKIGMGVLTMSVPLLITVLPLGIALLSVGIAIFGTYAFILAFADLWVIPVILNLFRLVSEGRGKKMRSALPSLDESDVIDSNTNM